MPAGEGYAGVTQSEIRSTTAPTGPGLRAARRAPAGRGAPRRWRAAESCQQSLRRPLPVASDVAVATVAASAAAPSLRAAPVMAVALLVTGLVFGVWKHRSTVQAQGVSWYLRRVAVPVTVSAAALSLYPGLSGRSATVAGAAAYLALTVTKMAQWLLVGAARRRGIGLRRTLVIGPERAVAGAEYRIHLYPESGLVCAESLVLSPASGDTAPGELEALLRDHGIEHVVCAGADSGTGTVARDVIRLAPAGVDVTVVSTVALAGAAQTRLGDLAVVCLGRPSWGTRGVKRLLDVAASLVLLVLLSPVLAATAAAIRLGDGGPALFCQRRTGYGNRMFTIFKFRSMVEDAEALKEALRDRNVADGMLFKAEDDPRITRVGAVIRRFSIDELPQLFNVVRGEMSLVGPRPLPNAFDDRDVFARSRHSARPGITGLWQVKGANALSYEDMIDLDCAYVATRSLGLDLRILGPDHPGRAGPALAVLIGVR